MKKVIEKLPTGWTEKPLKENNTFLRRGKSPEYCENSQGLFVINQDCVRWDSIDLDKVKFHVVPNRIDESFFLRSGDILINSTGTGTIGRVNQWLYQDVNAVADSHVTVLRVTEESIDTKYARYFLTSEPGQRYLASVCYTGSTNQIELSKRYLSKLSLPCAPLPEQKAIAGILSKVDEAIEAVENSIKAAERLKKSLMQNLLTGKLKPDGTWRSEDEFYVDDKFGKVPKGWEVRKGKRLFKAFGSTSFDKIDSSEVGDCIYMKVSDFNLEGNDFYIDTAKIMFSYEKNSFLSYCQPGFLVVSKRGEAIRKNRVRILNKRTLLDPNLMAFEIIDGEPLFYKFLLEEMNLQRFLENSALPQLNNKDFYPRRFLYPPVDVQKVISRQLLNVYSEICSKKAKDKLLKKLKKSLMQNLLTGKVRVDVEKINKLLEEV